MEPLAEKSSYICHKGHEFIPTLYHFPTNCEACTKPLWNMFKPPPALECRRCHIKCHKDHMDKKEEIIAPCKGRLFQLMALQRYSFVHHKEYVSVCAVVLQIFEVLNIQYLLK